MKVQDSTKESGNSAFKSELSSTNGLETVETACCSFSEELSEQKQWALGIDEAEILDSAKQMDAMAAPDHDKTLPLGQVSESVLESNGTRTMFGNVGLTSATGVIEHKGTDTVKNEYSLDLFTETKDDTDSKNPVEQQDIQDAPPNDVLEPIDATHASARAKLPTSKDTSYGEESESELSIPFDEQKVSPPRVARTGSPALPRRPNSMSPPKKVRFLSEYLSPTLATGSSESSRQVNGGKITDPSALSEEGEKRTTSPVSSSTSSKYKVAIPVVFSAPTSGSPPNKVVEPERSPGKAAIPKDDPPARQSPSSQKVPVPDAFTTSERGAARPGPDKIHVAGPIIVHPEDVPQDEIAMDIQHHVEQGMVMLRASDVAVETEIMRPFDEPPTTSELLLELNQMEHAMEENSWPTRATPDSTSIDDEAPVSETKTKSEPEGSENDAKKKDPDGVKARDLGPNASESGEGTLCMEGIGTGQAACCIVM